MNPQRTAQQGFAAIAAVFLVVILAAFGAFMVSFSNTQQLTSAQDVQGSRAYWAARAGLEWAIASVLATAPVAPATSPAATCPVSTPPASLDGFALTITCSSQAYVEGGMNLTVFALQSTATAGGAAGSTGYVERSVSASLEQP
jgi:MSHA biogenesis protein MshP